MVNSVKPYSLRDSVRIRALVSFFSHADPGEPFPASLLRHCVGICSHSYDSVFPRHHSRFSLAQERRRSHIRRGNSLPLLVLLLTALPSLLLEKEKGNGTCLKKKHISLCSFNMTSVCRNIGGRGVLLHLLLSLLQFSSDSFSAQQRSLARKKFRNCSKSFSSAYE